MEYLNGQELVNGNPEGHQRILSALEFQQNHHSPGTATGVCGPKGVRVAPQERFSNQLGVQFLQGGEVDSAGVIRGVGTDQSLYGGGVAEQSLERGILHGLVPGPRRGGLAMAWEEPTWVERKGGYMAGSAKSVLNGDASDTNLPPVFLTASWINLVMLNYEVDPKTLAPFVPPGIELDAWQGRTLASIVGFEFADVRVLNRSIPFHRDFEEMNQRFYVRRRTADGWRRGVVVRELVPLPTVALLARVLYGEPYKALPMDRLLSYYHMPPGASGLGRVARHVPLRAGPVV